MNVLIKRLQEKGALLERGLVCRQPLSLEREKFISYATKVYRLSNNEDLEVLRWYFEVGQQWIAKNKRQRKNRPSVCFRPRICRSPLLGLYDRLMVEARREDPKAFNNFMRMPPEMFDEIVEKLTPALTNTATKLVEPLEPGLKVAIALRYLAAGTKYHEMQYAWRVPHNTISKVVHEVCKAIIVVYHGEQLKPPNADDWREITDAWMRDWNFPHVIGAIAGKHIAFRSTANNGSDYCNCKGFYSIVLLAVVTSDYKFLWVDTNGKGSSSYKHIYDNSELKEALEKNDIIGFPQPDPLPGDTQDIPYFLVGDDSFSLNKYMMKPYRGRRTTHRQRIFNYRLLRARRVVDNTFGILADRFQVLLTTMAHDVDTVKLLVKACVLLHNLMRTRYPLMQNKLLDIESSNGHFEPGTWRKGKNLEDIYPFTTYRITPAIIRDLKIANAQRTLITDWCSGAGKVSWQDELQI